MAADYDMVIRGGTIADGMGGDLVEGDIAITGGRIAAIGKNLARGTQEIDAQGKIVTPGFIDVHTHYDGQCIWAEELSPSSSHGVTTAVMGNCGVGFAPCRKSDREMLVNVMEGVEDIPGVVMTEGLAWDWVPFPNISTRSPPESATSTSPPISRTRPCGFTRWARAVRHAKSPRRMIWH